jgi:putative transposase
MKKSKFTEEQIAFALRQAQAGIRVEEIYRTFGVSRATSATGKSDTAAQAYRRCVV